MSAMVMILTTWIGQLVTPRRIGGLVSPNQTGKFVHLSHVTPMHYKLKDKLLQILSHSKNVMILNQLS